MLEPILRLYGQQFPEDMPSLDVLAMQVARGDKLNDRKLLPGHVTGSAIVLSPDRSKVLVIHHVFLDMWIQPGGHWDADEPTPLEAARREAIEETGVAISEYLPLNPGEPLLPLDIETHAIPANPRKSEPEHYHHDFRYVFVASSEKLATAEAEVSEAAWVAFDDLRTDGLHRVIPKLRRLQLIDAA